MYEDLKVASAQEISALQRQIQQLQESRDPPKLIASERIAHDAELARRVADLERRLVVRATNALGRNALTGRAVRTLGILRRDWKEL